MYQGWGKYLRDANGFATEKSNPWKLLSEEQKGTWSMIEREYNAWMREERGKLEFTAESYMANPIEFSIFDFYNIICLFCFITALYRFVGKFSLTGRLSEYKPRKGPLWPSKPKKIPDEVEVSRLIHRPRSRPVDLWKRGNLAHLSETLNETPNLYQPSQDTRIRSPKVI